jgi:hypothetical protein
MLTRSKKPSIKLNEKYASHPAQELRQMEAAESQLNLSRRECARSGDTSWIGFGCERRAGRFHDAACGVRATSTLQSLGFVACV